MRSASVHARKIRRLRRNAGLRVLLDQDGLRAEGTLEELRDRRLRFDVMKADPRLYVPIYDNDLRNEGLPATTAELHMQSSRNEIVPTGPGERAPVGLTDGTQAPESLVKGGNFEHNRRVRRSRSLRRRRRG